MYFQLYKSFTFEENITFALMNISNKVEWQAAAGSFRNTGVEYFIAWNRPLKPDHKY